VFFEVYGYLPHDFPFLLEGNASRHTANFIGDFYFIFLHIHSTHYSNIKREGIP
ncbi:hypothetical protein V3C99_006852, partial [Haemonchus contortus]